MATSKIKAIATTQRKDRKMDDSGEGERIFRLQMSHYLNYYSDKVPSVEDPLNVNDFMGLLHSIRATRRWKKRGQQLLTLLYQITPSAENEPLEHTLMNHYYRACFLWHFYWVDKTENPSSLGQVGDVAASSILKPARYFFQQLVSAKVLRRRKRSTFDLVRPFASAFGTTLQMISEIIESDKLLGESVWNYGSFMNAVSGCISYTSPCRRTIWVLRLRRIVSDTLPIDTSPIEKNTTRRKRSAGVRKTRRHRRHTEPTDPVEQPCE